jgi:transcriptional regulator with XRE-family HTH domain
MRDWLKKLREEKGLTQGQVAAAVGISQNMYHYIETGQRIAVDKCDVEKRIACILNFDWTRFLAKSFESNE